MEKLVSQESAEQRTSKINLRDDNFETAVSSDFYPPKTNHLTIWRCSSYWKWEVFQCHVSFQGCKSYQKFATNLDAKKENTEVAMVAWWNSAGNFFQVGYTQEI